VRRPLATWLPGLSCAPALRRRLVAPLRRLLACAPARRALGASLVLLALSPAGCRTLDAARAYAAGTAALERGDTTAALAELERAAALEPHSSAVQNHLGIAYEAAADLDAAERAYERALALDCENAAAAHNLEALRARRAAAEGAR